jgi:hypothetical protein
MKLTLLSSGKLRIVDQLGSATEIGPEHPDYATLCTQYRKSVRPDYGKARLLGILAIAVGVAGWWYNWHLLRTEHQFYPKLTLLGPLGLFGGLLMIFRPEWAGPLRNDSSKAHKLVLIGLIVLMALGAGLDYYLLSHYRT